MSRQTVVGAAWLSLRGCERMVASWTELARARGLFCMEAHWTTFLSMYDVLHQLLDNKALGELTAVVADFGEWFPPDHRLFRPELGGGPLLDLGLYLVSFAVNVLGLPDQVVASSITHASGVTAQTGLILTHGDMQSVLHTTILATPPPRSLRRRRRPSVRLPGDVAGPRLEVGLLPSSRPDDAR